MLDKLKTEFDGILELVQKCPPDLQDTALKTILERWFAVNSAPPLPPTNNTQSSGAPPGAVPESVKLFMNANGITAEILGKAFQPMGPGALLVASAITGSGKGTQQVHLAILLSVRQALETGAFTCTLKELREMCVHYNCYDSSNFSQHLKTNKNYFKPRQKGADLELSGPGMKKAGELIKGMTPAS